MQDIKPQEVFANLDFQAAPGNDVEAARQCVWHALNCVAQAFADQGGLKNLAVLFQADPLSAEIAFRGDFFHLGRTILSGAFESFDVTAHPLYKPLKLRNSFRANCSVKMPLSPLATTI